MALTDSVEEIVKSSKNPLLGKHEAWGRVKLGEIAKVQNGFAFKSELFTREKRGMPIIRIRDVGEDDTDTYYTGEYPAEYIVRAGDLLIGMDGDFNCARWRGPDALLNQRVCRIIPTSKAYEPKLLDHALPGYLKAINDVTSSVTVKHLSSRTVAEIPLPLPPLPQQRRIVSAIELQLGRLDAAVARLQAAKAKLKRYKQAVLKEAFSGNITEAWRAKAKVTPVDEMLARIETPPRPSRYKSRSMDVVDGDYALAIGAPERQGPPGWKWLPLVDIARLESGHTPSKRHPEYWEGDVPWIELRDARDRHGSTIHTTTYHTNQLGLDNSAARLLPAGTVCLSRTASVGYVVKMGVPMCTSQDFVNWVCTEAIDPDWLKILFVAENDAIWRFGKGTTHTTVYFPEVVSFHVMLPPIEEQREIVRLVGDALAATEAMETTLDAELLRSTRLRQAVLKRAFEGRLV